MTAVKTGGVAMAVQKLLRLAIRVVRIVRCFMSLISLSMIQNLVKIVIRTVIVVDLWRLAITYLWHIKKLLRGNLSHSISQILTMDLDLSE